MLCAWCGESTADDPCAKCKRTPTLKGRYRLEEIVGRGARGTTYRATDLESSATVAVKEMAYRQAPTVKALELLDREAAILRQLGHPSIPRLLETFEFGEAKHRAMYVIQEFIDGKTLADELAVHRYTEQEVLRIVGEVASILEYLHGLAPPVIHRDLKPANVMRRAADDRLVLIDFGAVRDLIDNRALGGSTVAGTFGFMAPEQFRGEASPATDLYGLGALAIALLSRRDPSSLLGVDGQLAWEPVVSVHTQTKSLLHDLLAQDPRARESSAERVVARVRAILDGRPTAAALGRRPQRPLPARRKNGDLALATRILMTVTLGPIGFFLVLAALFTLLKGSAGGLVLFTMALPFLWAASLTFRSKPTDDEKTDPAR